MKNVINTEMLTNKINDSGLKRSAIASKLDLTCAGLNKKLKCKTEFKASEIQAIAKTIGLSKDEVFAIFFTDFVGKTTTSISKGA